MKKLTPKMRVWLSTEDGEGCFGIGRFRLLKAIKQEGSLADAARHLGMSYRKAWGDLKKIEQELDCQLIHKSRGGAAGGSSLLTEEGEHLLDMYAALLEQMNGALKTVDIKSAP